MTRTKRNKIMLLSLAMLILVVALTKIAPAAYSQQSNDQWSLNFSILNGQNVASTTFAPFEPIQLTSTVTYGNASVPDLLVTFKVQGPTGSANLINITAIAKTNAKGVADSTFRLPAETGNAAAGTWQATATIRTSNSTLQKSLSFTTQWNLEITSISVENQQGHNQTIFYPSNTLEIALAISDTGPSQQANITLNMQDSSGKIVNQTQIENAQITNSSSPYQTQTTLEIPATAGAGEASITAAITSGSYENTGIPAGENQTAYFTIVSGSAISPSPGPTATTAPTLLQNSVSLFSWLLVATGLFTFTMLYIFLRRKPMVASPQMPNIPVIKSSPALAPSPVGIKEQTPPNQPPSPPKPTTGISPPNTIQAAMTMEAPAILETWNTQMSTPDTARKPDTETPPQQPAQTIMTHLRKISEEGRKVQALEDALKVERTQLNQEMTELNKTLEEQEKAVKNYFDSIRQAVAAALSQPAETNEKQYVNPLETSQKPAMQPTQSTKATEDQKTQQLETPEPAEAAVTTQPEEINEKTQINPVKIDLKNQTSPIQVTKTDNEQKIQPPEDNNKKNVEPSEQSNTTKNAKESLNKSQKRTQQEDIKIAEHTRED